MGTLEEGSSSSESGSLLLETDLDLSPSGLSILLSTLFRTSLMTCWARVEALALSWSETAPVSLKRSAKGWQPSLTDTLPSEDMVKSLSLTVVPNIAVR